MIETLRIESFKSIAEAQLDLGQVNVFIGANGSGKSNLLEAIALLSAAASGKVDQSTLVWRGVRASRYFRPMFEGTKNDAETSLEASFKTSTYRTTLSAPDSGRSLPWDYKVENLTTGRKVIADRSKLKHSRTDSTVGFAALKLAEVAPDSAASVFMKSLLEYAIYSADTPILHGWTLDQQEREPVGLGGGRLAEAIAEILADTALGKLLKNEFVSCIDWFAEFGVLRILNRNREISRREFAFMDRYFKKTKGVPDFLGTGDVNEGVLFLAFLAVLGLHPRAPKIFAVENVDHGLNPRLAKRMMTTLAERILKAEDRQAFLTTHNPLVLDGLPLYDERVRLFTVARTDSGRSVIRRVEVSDKLLKMADQGWTLSRLWVMGHLGGVPNV